MSPSWSWQRPPHGQPNVAVDGAARRAGGKGLRVINGSGSHLVVGILHPAAPPRSPHCHVVVHAHAIQAGVAPNRDALDGTAGLGAVRQASARDHLDLSYGGAEAGCHHQEVLPYGQQLRAAATGRATGNSYGQPRAATTGSCGHPGRDASTRSGRSVSSQFPRCGLHSSCAHNTPRGPAAPTTLGLQRGGESA